MTPNKVEIYWETPSNQGGGSVRVTSYDVQVEAEDGSWISNDADICDGWNDVRTYCSVRKQVIESKSLKKYDGLFNVRVMAINQIGRSDMSLPLFNEQVTNVVSFGDSTSWSSVFSVDELQHAKITQVRYKKSSGTFLTGF